MSDQELLIEAIAKKVGDCNLTSKYFNNLLHIKHTLCELITNNGNQNVEKTIYISKFSNYYC